MIRFPKEKNKKKKINYFKNYGLLKILKINTSEFDPNFSDLYRLHQFIILNKRTTVLEFGMDGQVLLCNMRLISTVEVCKRYTAFKKRKSI